MMIGKFKVISLLTILPLSIASAYADQSIVEERYSPEELYELGLDYEVLEQTDKSFFYFDKAAQMNYVPAMLKMVSIHRQEGRTKDAIEILEKAVKTGDASAIYEKAKKICDRQPTYGNRECIKLLSISANKGYAPAYRKLADFRTSPKQSYNDYLMAYSIDGKIRGIFNYAEKAGYDLERIVSDIGQIQREAGNGETDIAENLGWFLRNYTSGRYTSENPLFPLFSDKIVDVKALNLSSKYFQKVLENDPSRKDIYSNLAEDEAYGFGGKQNWNKAFQYMKLAAEADPEIYNSDVAFLHYLGLGTKQDIDEALKLAPASENLNFFAAIYAKGSGVPQDFGKFVNLQLEQYAIKTLDNYQSFLSELGKRKHQVTARVGETNSSEKSYSQVFLLVLDKNYEQALKYLIKASEQGHDKAIELTAALYARGLGCKKNYKTSFEWLEKIKKQSLDVKNLIGQCYLYGLNGYEKNRIKAKELLKGISNRYIDLSEDIPVSTKTKMLFLPQEDILKNGLRIKNKDLSIQQSQEAYYYLLSASEESGEASNLLGEIALKHLDIAKAKKYFEKAVSQGYSWANKNIGLMYLNGYGTLPNLEKAYEYYSKAYSDNAEYFYMSRNISFSSSLLDPLKIQLLHKAIQRYPSHFGAWHDLLILDPRTGDKDYQYKLLGEACLAAKTNNSLFCREYKALKSGQPSVLGMY